MAKAKPNVLGISDLIKTLPVEQADRAYNLAISINQRLRWQSSAYLYMVERLGIDPRTLDWTMCGGGYNLVNFKWDGTPNPIMEILDGLSNSEWVGVTSAKGVGKTFLAACIVLWFLECFENSIVVTTAPKGEQLELHVWKEITKLYPTFGYGELSKLKLRMIPGSNQWGAFGFIAGVKAQDAQFAATRAQGFHAEHMLIILEETPGILNPVITAFVETCTAPHNIILALGNPNYQMDELAKFISHEGVRHVRISALDHPNYVMNDPNFVPGAVSRMSVSRIRKKYGEDSPMCQSRIHGLIPKQASDSLIQLDWVYRAIERYKNYVPKADDVLTPAIGVDVANSETGDKSGLSYGEGNILKSVVSEQCPNANDLGHKVHLLMLEQKIKDEHCGVDGVGVGAGTVNTLKEYGRDVRNLMGGPVDVMDQEEKFLNLRAQMFWQLREDFRNDRIMLAVEDDELILDLVTVKWKVSNGKIQIESKDDIRRRLGGRSTNKGDSVAYWNWVRDGSRSDKGYAFGFYGEGGNPAEQLTGEELDD